MGDVITGLDTATGAIDVRTIVTWTNSTLLFRGKSASVSIFVGV